MEYLQLVDRDKRNIMMVADAWVLAFALWAAVALRYGEMYKDVTSFLWLFPSASLLGILSFYKLGLYHAIVRYIGPSSMLPVLKGVTIASIGVSLLAYTTGSIGFPRTAPIIFWFIAILLIGGSRIIVRAYFYGIFSNYLSREPIAIYGAGDSGAQLAITLLNGEEYTPAAFIDDDRRKRKTTIHGIRVYDSGHIDRLISTLGIKQILLAIPSASPLERKTILGKLTELPVHVRTVPTFDDLMTGRADVAQIEEINIDDLLGRDSVPPDPELLSASIKGKSVLVTGAGGTIGSELCRNIAGQQPQRLVVFDSSELAIYNIEREFSAKYPDIKVDYILGSILNSTHLNKVVQEFQVQTVYHAAAYKHVPMVERNILEGVRNNVIGTWRVAQVVANNQVEVFVMISTDKAVRPTNVMGASKRLAELVVQAFEEKFEKTRFCMVRFGNVLLSSGSVVPLFQEQIQKGGPVTVTHKDATRFFMTLSEAAELVIQAGALAAGGEVFVLDMGEPVKIQHLAEQMIHLHGREVKPEGITDDEDNGNFIEIVHSGLRPAEKLYEELVIGQNISGTRHPKILKAEEDRLTFEEMKLLYEDLVRACENTNYPLIKQSLERYVHGYTMSANIVDPGFLFRGIHSQQSNVRSLWEKSTDV